VSMRVHLAPGWRSLFGGWCDLRELQQVARPGAVVRSRYRSPWTGVVLRAADPQHVGAVVVQMTHDRRGRPITKPGRDRRRVIIHPYWLRLVTPAPTSS
jgi:hypothetical protein